MTKYFLCFRELLLMLVLLRRIDDIQDDYLNIMKSDNDKPMQVNNTNVYEKSMNMGAVQKYQVIFDCLNL